MWTCVYERVLLPLGVGVRCECGPVCMKECSPPTWGRREVGVWTCESQEVPLDIRSVCERAPSLSSCTQSDPQDETESSADLKNIAHHHSHHHAWAV